MEQTQKPAEPPKTGGKKTWAAIVGAVIVIIVVVSALYLTGYIGGGGGGPGTPLYIFESPRGTCSSSTNCGYTPNPLDVAKDAKVTFTFNSTILHTATACSTTNAPTATECPTMNDTSLPSFDSGTSGLSNDQTFSVNFNTPGAYHFYCRFHNWMRATVNVSA